MKSAYLNIWFCFRNILILFHFTFRLFLSACSWQNGWTKTNYTLCLCMVGDFFSAFCRTWYHGVSHQLGYLLSGQIPQGTGKSSSGSDVSSEWKGTTHIVLNLSCFLAFWGFCFGCDCFGVLSLISNIVMFYNSDDICTFLAFQKNLHVFVEMIVVF